MSPRLSEERVHDLFFHFPLNQASPLHIADTKEICIKPMQGL